MYRLVKVLVQEYEVKLLIFSLFISIQHCAKIQVFSLICYSVYCILSLAVDKFQLFFKAPQFLTFYFLAVDGFQFFLNVTQYTTFQVYALDGL